MTIEGIPEGWELVRIGSVCYGEWRLMKSGSVMQWDVMEPSLGWAVVLRKIEKPKQYRPFANAAEAEPFFDRRLRYKADDSAIMRITVLGRNGIEIAKDRHTYKEAFDRFVLTDGTPFGIEVTE